MPQYPEYVKKNGEWKLINPEVKALDSCWKGLVFRNENDSICPNGYSFILDNEERPKCYSNCDDPSLVAGLFCVNP